MGSCQVNGPRRVVVLDQPATLTKCQVTQALHGWRHIFKASPDRIGICSTDNVLPSIELNRIMH